MSLVEGLHSRRFACAIALTAHARKRMSERNISEQTLLDLIETGEVRHKDAHRFWIAAHFADRQDNLLCAAVVQDARVLVVKTLMHYFTWESPS